MRIEKITVSELPSYLESDSFRASTEVPITRLRAISQSKNPRAAANDIALLVARDENDQLLSFVGMLPDTVFEENRPLKLWTNSCWWAHPQIKENGAAQLFFLACKMTGNQLFFPDLTPHTIRIVENMRQFSVLRMGNGIRGYLRLNLGTLLPGRRQSLSRFSVLLSSFDSIVNCMYSPVLFFWKHKLSRKSLQYKIAENIDESTYAFISQMNRHEVFRRTREDLNWIISNPWIATNPLPEGQKYGFTHTVSSFKNVPVTVYFKGAICAFFILLIRNGHAQLTYFYSAPACLSEPIEAIFDILLRENAITFTAFHSDVTDFIFAHKHPFLHIRRQTKTVGFSKAFDHIITENALQHGDGDCAFV